MWICDGGMFCELAVWLSREPCGANKHCSCGERAALLSHVDHRSTATDYHSSVIGYRRRGAGPLPCLSLCPAEPVIPFDRQCCVISDINHAVLTSRLPIFDIHYSSNLRPPAPVCDTARNDRSPASLPQVPSPRRVPPTQTPILAPVFRLYRPTVLCSRSRWLLLPLWSCLANLPAFIHLLGPPRCWPTRIHRRTGLFKHV